MSVNPPRTPSQAAALADHIQQRIGLEAMADGAVLGTEATLAAEHHVSQTVAREAVIRLKALGMLESRQGKGLVVRHPCPVGLLATALPLLAQSVDDVQELTELRYVIEVGAIELAVQNADDEQIEQLAELSNRFEEVALAGAAIGHHDNDLENEIELAFHGLILQMSGVGIIARLQSVLVEFWQLVDIRFEENPPDETIWQHHFLVAAIRDRDIDRARSMMRAHFCHLLRTRPPHGTEE